MSTGFKKLLGSKNMVIFAVFLVLVGGFLSYSSGKSTLLDGMASDPIPSALPGETSVASSAAEVSAAHSLGGMQPVNSPADLLPADSNSGWAALNPGNLPSSDLMDPTKLIGITTTSQTFKNPNLQLRSDPYIEKVNVGPWMQTPDIGPDLYRTKFEIGYGPVE